MVIEHSKKCYRPDNSFLSLLPYKPKVMASIPGSGTHNFLLMAKSTSIKLVIEIPPALKAKKEVIILSALTKCSAGIPKLGLACQRLYILWKNACRH